MASFTHVFTDGETPNWFKAFIALNITKERLENFVDREIQNVHATVGRSCELCLTENLLKCPTKGICKNTMNCNFHNTQLKKPRSCASSICEQILKNITSQHRYSGLPGKNTKAEPWTSNHWEIAKCFFQCDICSRNRFQRSIKYLFEL
ncbi:hypothetical protein DPMN_164247 [Dreissena polymorpha]|uniref:Uncharacterized protein n=1 Tax=Dreissena polymorpha TaxID=45954 RepID=A0A9D4ESJ8_DREPO|nr:hypothetical protein DPMN_164247 [Dreissena polymorpha]